jgi:hypothetical protein
MPWRTIPGKLGPTLNLRQVKCPEAKADGARAKICPGNLCGPSLSSKLPTITCKATVSVIRRSSEDGATTRNRPTAPMRSSKLFRRRRSQQFSHLVGEEATPLSALVVSRWRQSGVGSSSGSGVVLLWVPHHSMLMAVTRLGNTQLGFANREFQKRYVLQTCSTTYRGLVINHSIPYLGFQLRLRTAVAVRYCWQSVHHSFIGSTERLRLLKMTS